jgi:hypothetical protein
MGCSEGEEGIAESFRRKKLSCCAQQMKRWGARYHYRWSPENACTKVQVFHREYRENEAKTEAKVGLSITCSFSFVYNLLDVMRVVLGDSFGTKNVSPVPSRLELAWCQMGQVWRTTLTL